MMNDNLNSMMAIFNVLIGVYCTYSAITGKGSAYKNDYPEEIKEVANKSMRKLLAVIGPIALITGVFDYFGNKWFGEGANRIVQYVGIGVMLALIIAYIVWFRVKFSKQLKNPKVKKVQ